ncbi:MAG: ATP-binding cassette domain-containing protein [Ignavibacteriae bacterium]|nr:ATP-binding cassette domain-containing protein [Ignavibacteriota bacterium]
MIKIKGLNKSYGKLKALNDIDLMLKKGEIVALLGPNGSGKTTLLKCILGLVLPECGQITVSEIDIKKDYRYRELIGYMPQVAYFPDNLKVKEVIAIIKDIRKKNEHDAELMNAFKIDEMMNKKISSLSQGMKQRLSGALTFLFDSEIIILDEPTAGLDPVSAEFMKNKIIKEKTKGKLIIITTHIINEVEELADRFLFMFEGRIKLERKIDKIKVQNNGFKSSIAKLFEQYEWS